MKFTMCRLFIWMNRVLGSTQDLGMICGESSSEQRRIAPSFLPVILFLLPLIVYHINKLHVPINCTKKTNLMIKHLQFTRSTITQQPSNICLSCEPSHRIFQHTPWRRLRNCVTASESSSMETSTALEPPRR
jgi:hypothetical protein